MAKQTIKQSKVLRSAAAKKGAREMIDADLGHPLLVPVPIIIKASTWEEARALSLTAKPNVTIQLPKAAPLRPSLWQRIKGWFA